MKKILFVIFVLTLSLAVSSLAVAQDNKSAVWMIDTDLANIGCQPGVNVSGVGADSFVGFPIYAKGFDDLGAFEINITWEAAGSAVLYTEPGFGEIATSASLIEVPAYPINGAEDQAIAAENNVFPEKLGEPTADAGSCMIAIASTGDAVASADYKLLYFPIFKTASDFTESTQINFIVSVKIVNGAGTQERDLGYRYFYVNGSGTDVKTSTWGEVKSQFKD